MGAGGKQRLDDGLRPMVLSADFGNVHLFAGGQPDGWGDGNARVLEFPQVPLVRIPAKQFGMVEHLDAACFDCSDPGEVKRWYPNADIAQELAATS